MSETKARTAHGKSKRRLLIKGNLGGKYMEELDKAISILMRLLFRPAGRAEIDRTIKEVIDLLQKINR